MSLASIRSHLAAVAGWAEEAPLDEMEAAEASARANFPLPALAAAMMEDEFPALEDGIAALEDWFAAADPARLEAISTAIGRPTPKIFVKAARDQLAVLLPEWEDTGDGAVRPVPTDARPNGRRRFHSLGEAALSGGVAVSVFDRPIRATPVFDAAAALGAPSLGALARLAPVGLRADYRVTIHDGRLRHPPAWPADLRREAEAADAEGPTP